MSCRVSHSILPGNRVIIQCYQGSVSLSAIEGAATQLWADPEYDRTFDGIADLRHIVPALTPKDVTSLGELLKGSAQCSTGRWAVVTNDPIITALGMLYTRLSLRPSIAIFSTWSAACSYLQVTLPLPP